MATWRAENSMLTTRGIEILSKIKAGNGSITITKIVAGSGRVSESLLSNQTQVSGTTKPMVLSLTEFRDGGSEISVYIQNEGFTEDFILNQIGVYVSHPDYEGEQLYHISQCDAEGYDTIPAFEYTVTTFGYSLFLEHGNSSSINITVDPQGIIGRDEFEQYKSNLAEELKSVDKGKVSRTLLWENASESFSFGSGFNLLFPESFAESGYDGFEIVYYSSKTTASLYSSGYLPIPQSFSYGTPSIPFRLTAFEFNSFPLYIYYRDVQLLETTAGSGVLFWRGQYVPLVSDGEVLPNDFSIIPWRIYGIKGTVNEIPSVTV